MPSALSVLPLLAQTATEPDTTIEVDPPASFGEAFVIIQETVVGLWEGLLASLPLLLIGGIVILVGVYASRYAGSATQRAGARAGADMTVLSLGSRIARASVFIVFLLLALAVAGIPVSSAVAGLGIAGLAVAFALQNILENFIAGILLLIRKPFRVGDQIITGDLEGTVDDINLRVTKIVSYDGELLLVPNADVFSDAITNLTERGNRRSRVDIGVDYRDDHNAVPALLEAAVAQVDGVLSEPSVAVRCTALGASSVDFTIFYWTAPDIATVVGVRDRVTRRAKDAVEGAGMTIPWPIRTLAWDAPPEG